MKTMIIIALLLSGCGTGAMKFYNPQMKTSLECTGGVGWQAQENKKLCVETAMASGYQLQGQ